jgi:hypothetical protein
MFLGQALLGLPAVIVKIGLAPLQSLQQVLVVVLELLPSLQGCVTGARGANFHLGPSRIALRGIALFRDQFDLHLFLLGISVIQ